MKTETLTITVGVITVGVAGDGDDRGHDGHDGAAQGGRTAQVGQAAQVGRLGQARFGALPERIPFEAMVAEHRVASADPTADRYYVERSWRHGACFALDGI